MMVTKLKTKYYNYSINMYDDFRLARCTILKVITKCLSHKIKNHIKHEFLNQFILN